jgi:hypothetical protein
MAESPFRCGAAWVENTSSHFKPKANSRILAGAAPTMPNSSVVQRLFQEPYAKGNP